MPKPRLLKMGMAVTDGPRVVGGSGTRLLLDDGREVLDAATTPAPLGHRHPRVVEAVRRAAAEAPTLDEGWSTPLREQAAETLLGTVFAGEAWVGAVRFALTGSEANDLALSLAQALSGRGPIVTRERAYHGMVGLSRDATVQPQWHGGISDRSGRVRPVPPGAEVRRLPFPRGRFGDGVELSEAAAAEALAGADALLEDAAAVIVDYTQGGCYAAPAYQDVLARRARRAGALWIADEVITAFGKGGRWLNLQRGAERPDMVTLGKPMGGGLMPVAALVVSAEVLERIGDGVWQNYSSLRSTDLGAAAALAFMRVVEEEDLVARADRLHDAIVAGMRALAAAHPAVSRVDGRGLHWWIELGDADWQRWDGAGSAAPIATRVARQVLEAGALVATSGERNALLVTLPMIVDDAEVAALLAALDHGLALADRELAAGAVPAGSPTSEGAGHADD